MSEEYLRSILTSVVAGLASNAAIGLLAHRWAPAYAVLTFAGNMLGYVLDIVFAKRAFRLRPCDEEDTPVAYGDLSARLRLLRNVLLSSSTARLVVVVVLDAATGGVMFSNLVRALAPTSGAMVSLLSAASSVATFATFSNTLRFRWAYQRDPEWTTGVAVVAWTWLTLAVASRGNAHA